MGISYVPGVGPTNADIATAVAAPSAATIASTVAASVPTLSQINTAVNTQTNNSAIASAVAGAVPNLSQINTAVATNAPSPSAWVVLASATPNYSSTSITFSGLSGYRTYRVLMPQVIGSGGNLANLSFRLNGDAGSNYSYRFGDGNGSTSIGAFTAGDTQQIIMNRADGSSGVWRHTDITIEHASLASPKRITWSSAGYSSGSGASTFTFEGVGMWKSTATVNSITLFNQGVSVLGGSTVYVLGVN